jgi:hypothetical protein
MQSFNGHNYSIYRRVDAKNNKNKHAYAGQLNSFTPLAVLLVLTDRGIYTVDACNNNNDNKHACAGQTE